MAQEQPQPQGKPQGAQVKISDDMLKGFYSNMMQVHHTKDEFVLDYISLFGPQGTVGSRVIVSPSHLKRMVAALADNLKKYEQQFGTITGGEPAARPEIGFSVKDNS